MMIEFKDKLGNEIKLNDFVARQGNMSRKDYFYSDTPYFRRSPEIYRLDFEKTSCSYCFNVYTLKPKTNEIINVGNQDIDEIFEYEIYGNMIILKDGELLGNTSIVEAHKYLISQYNTQGLELYLYEYDIPEIKAIINVMEENNIKFYKYEIQNNVISTIYNIYKHDNYYIVDECCSECRINKKFKLKFYYQRESKYKDINGNKIRNMDIVTFKTKDPTKDARGLVIYDDKSKQWFVSYIPKLYESKLIPELEHTFLDKSEIIGTVYTDFKLLNGYLIPYLMRHKLMINKCFIGYCMD